MEEKIKPKPLKKLLADISYTPAKNCKLSKEALMELEIPSVVCDGRKLQEGCLFICCRHTNYNGPEYLKKAADAGAAVILTERDIAKESPDKATPGIDGPIYLFVEDARYAMAFLYSAWYDHPSEKLFTIGVTGTKGKTTTSCMIQRMLQAAGHKTGLVSTLEYLIGDERIEALNTTPEAELLQHTLYRMVQAGLDSVVIETSSLALQYHRSQGIIFDMGIFTNIGEDHIGPGEAADFDHYLEYKSRLLRQCRTGLVNIDDPFIDRILAEHSCTIKTFGLSESADYSAANIVCEMVDSKPGVSFDARYISSRVYVPLPGRFTVYNSLAAIGAALQLKVPKEAILSTLREFSIPGRFQIVINKNTGTYPAPVAIVDYAHNPMSFEAVLSAIRQYYSGKIICVFGCGGDLYKGKRPEMGRVSTKLADYVFITNDNPRFEDPDSIVKEILSGIPDGRDNYSVIQDRREAVFAAFKKAASGDVVLLAGKGPESYQDIRGVKYPSDDYELAREALAFSVK